MEKRNKQGDNWQGRTGENVNFSEVMAVVAFIAIMLIFLLGLAHQVSTWI